MLRQKDDLPDMLRVMRDLSVDGLQDGMRLAADRNDPHDIFWLERINGAKHALPAFFPPLHHLGASRFRGSNSRSRCRSGFSPSLLRKSVKRDRMLPARCLTRMATEFDSGSRVTKNSSSR